MEPEDVVHVLRRLLTALVPGGRIVDLTSVRPSGAVEAGDVVLGEIDESAFFPRAEASAAALDALAAEGLLTLDSEERFPVLIRYPAGSDAVADVAERTYGRMPDELVAIVAAISGPVSIRETSSVRGFTRQK